MSTHRYTIVFEVDDELLAEWEGERPPSKDPSEWNFPDIIDAVNESLIDETDSEIESYEAVKGKA